MSIINESMKLCDIDKVLNNKILDCSIISDLNLSYDEYKIIQNNIKQLFKYDIDENILVSILEKFELTLSTFLVYAALYYYDGQYWSKVEEILPIKNMNIRNDIGEIFLKTIKDYNLKQFSDGGFKYVTPIICQAGIPNYSLKDIFDLIYDTIEDNNFSPQYMIDELKYFAKYRVDKTVYRFINYNEEKAIELFQNIRELMINAENDSANSFDNFEHVNNRIIGAYIKWKENKSITDKNIKRKKFILNSPKIKIDCDGFGIYIFIPSQIVREDTECLEWTIEYENGRQNSFKTNLLSLGENIISDEKTYKIGISDKYIVTMYCLNKKISSWEFEGINDNKPYMLFDDKGNLIKSDYISCDSVIVIFKKNYILSGQCINSIEMPPLPGDFSSNNIIKVSFDNNASGIKISPKDGNEKSYNIEYKRSNSIKLEGGRFLFDQEPNIEEIPIYSGRLPQICIEYNSDIFKEHIINEYKLIVKNKETNKIQEYSIKNLYYTDKNYKVNIEINMPDLNEKTFGEFEIRIYEKKNIKKIFAIRIVPLILTIDDKDNIWPDKTGEYNNKYFMYSAPDNINIIFDNEDRRINTNINNNKYIKIFINSSYEYAMGKLYFKLNGKEKFYYIRKRLKSFEWTWWDEKNNDINLNKHQKTFYIDDLKNQPSKYLILSLNSSIYEYVDAIIYLSDCRNNLQQKKFRINNNKSIRFSIDEFFDTMQSLKLKKSYINVKLMKDDIKICEFNTCKIKERVCIKSIECEFIENETKITWEQEGNLDDKIIKFYRIDKPWKQETVVNIKQQNIFNYGFRNGTIFNNNEIGLKEPGLYGIKIDDDNEDFLFDIGYDIPKLKKGMYIEYDIDKIISEMQFKDIPIERYISEVIALFKSKSLKIMYKNISNIDFTISCKNIIMISQMLCTIIYNLKAIKNISEESNYNYIRCITAKIISSFLNNENIYLLLKEIIKLNLETEDFKLMVKRLRLYYLPVVNHDILSVTDKQYLWDNIPPLAFITELRNIDINRNINLNNLYMWIGDDVIENILNVDDGKCNNKNKRICFENIIEGKCKNNCVNFEITDKVFGNVNDYTKLFEGKLDLIKCKSNDLYNDYIDNGLKIHGKTYIKIIYDWNQKCTIGVKQKLMNIVSDGSKLLNNICIRYKHFKYFGDIIDAYSKRIDNSINSVHNVFYYCGITVFLKTLEEYRLLDGLKRKEKVTIDKIYEAFCKYSYELFERDSIISELYIVVLKNRGIIKCQ